MRGQPEEEVRQQLVDFMITKLGYPSTLLLLEKGLNQLPHIQSQSLPNKRFDIIAMGANVHPDYPLYPLLLIECKAERLTQNTKHQVLGYNHYVKANVIAIASQQGCYFCDPAQSIDQWHKGLPSYQQLIERSKECIKK